jgi:5-methylthioribose kinase
MDKERVRFMRGVFEDTLAFAGAKMIRRILGLAHVEDLEAIADPERRARCEARALRLARELLVGPKGFSGLADVVSAARAISRA